ncbi:hypothetical protein FPV67DRAFT_1755906 [Lyophyllum atratum]|nr:hypothetical protein FPV67DRAFT_1755906 [Lyophyllum atratum]
MTKLEEVFDVPCAPSSDSFPFRVSPDAVSLLPNLALQSLDSSLPTTTTQVMPSGHNSSATRELFSLETENRRLQDEIAYLKLEAEVQEEELNKFRSDYYAERFQANVRKRLANSVDDSHEALKLRLKQAEKFILSMVEIGLHQPVLSGAWRAVAAGVKTDDALIDSIKRAAMTPGTSWSRIIPAVVGPRTPDDYLATIDMTLKVTKDLQDAKKISKFWKTKAKLDPSLKNLVTPSPSEISDTIVTEDLVQHGERAVDDLLKQLKSGGIHASTNFTQPAMVPSPTPAISVPPRVRTRMPVPQQSGFSRDGVLNSLAGQVFKHDIGDRHEQRVSVPQKTSDKQGTKLSARSHGKRKAILVKRVRSEVTLTARNSKDASHKPHSQMDRLPFDVDRTPLPLSTSVQSRTHPSGDIGTLTAEKALESLERICAGFSSGSLGSLGSSCESPTAENLQDFSTPMADNTHFLPPKLSAQPQLSSFAFSSIKTSPLASRFRQLRSLSRPSLLPSSQSRPLASSSPKATPSPAKKVLRKHTSPLRITKRVKVPTS